MENVATSDLPIKKVLQQAWREDPSAEVEAVLNLGLVSSSLHDDSEKFDYYSVFLGEFLELFSGERAFVFELEPVKGHLPELSGCAASLDLDGDPVSSPERKVSPEILLEIAAARKPSFRHSTESSEAGRRESSLLTLPALSRNRCQAVVVVENRFQNLSISDAAIKAARLYCQLLARQVELAHLVRENDSLWKDLSRLRDSMARETAPTAPAVPKSKIEKRKGLKGDYSMIVGSSPKILEILQVIDRISTSSAPVLINGESGTGKELIALAVHSNSPRKGKPFVSENCAAITETLLESELFGYVKGAFTGANKDHKGLFEVADGGTLFLDEVGDMSPSMQKKLLRVLQERVIRPVGGKDYVAVDVRIISATNKDILAECRNGNFREDLYYRLNVINLRLPPLRERREDIPGLSQYFLDEMAKETGTAKDLDPTAMQRFVQYSWPGNVRELQNEVKKVYALSDGNVITTEDLSEGLLVSETQESPFRDRTFDLSHMTLREATEQLEKEMIRTALAETGGNKSLVAKTLQIPKTSLYNKINKYKLG